MGETKMIAEPGVPQVVMTREFRASPDVLFRAYTEPELISQWWGPRRFSTTVDRFDLRHGGEWRFLNGDADGNEYGFHGLFTAPRRSTAASCRPGSTRARPVTSTSRRRRSRSTTAAPG